MTPTTTLSEPSFQNLIAAVEQAGELSDQRRRHWLCSLGQIANGSTAQPRAIPARWLSVRIWSANCITPGSGVTAKTLANHKSNVRAALRWFSKEHDVPRQGAVCRLSGQDFVTPSTSAHALPALSLHCGIARPMASIRRRSSDEIFVDYWRYRSATSARACNNTVPAA